ncbi:MAG: MmcQ/YjbR family DNA-binding protein [Microscillaceae bacterium]
MNIEDFRNFCLSLPATHEEMPFDAQTLVFKVAGKMFALTDIDAFDSITLKCEPEKAQELRAQYASVEPGYHMHKKYWNTLRLDGSLTNEELQHWILHSYEQVVAGLPKKIRQSLSESDAQF